MPRTHQDYHDRLSLSVHGFLLERLREKPDLLSLLKKQWTYWDGLPDFTCKAEYRQTWLDAIASGVEAVADICTREDDLGQVLRSCSPIGVLWDSAEERIEFIKKIAATI